MIDFIQYFDEPIDMDKNNLTYSYLIPGWPAYLTMSKEDGMIKGVTNSV